MLSNILKNILNLQKKIDINSLPSQGLFYNDDFSIIIKKADVEDIIEYEYKFDSDNISIIINKLKKIVENNVILPKKYIFNDIKSIDIVYLFLEIVKFTNNKNIKISFFNDKIGKEEDINFDSTNFNYIELSKNLLSKYNSETKEFIIDGFKYSLPSIGVENSLTNFLIHKSSDINFEFYNNCSYDFLYFLGHKNHLNYDEIDNLIHIFNYDISDEDRNIIRNIIIDFSGIGKYTLKKDSKVIDFTSKIDLENIWK